MTNRPAIIVSGDILNGLEFTGPFPDYDNAVEYTEDNGDITWVVADLQTPEGVVPSAEPVAWLVESPNEHFTTPMTPNPGRNRTITPLYAAPQPSTEPGSVHVINSPECGESYHALLTSYQALERHTEHVRTLHDELRAENGALRTWNKELDAVRASLLHSEKKRWAEIRELRAEVEDQRAKYHDLAMKSRKEWEELEALRASTIEYDLSAEIQELIAERDNLRNLYETVVDHRDSLFDALSDQTDKNAQLRNERDELSAKLEVQDSDYRALLDRLDRYSAHNSDLHDENEKLVGKLQALQYSYDALNRKAVKERDELSAKNVALMKQIEGQGKNYAALRDERDKLQHEVTQYQSVASPDYFAVVRERDNLKQMHDIQTGIIDELREVIETQGRIASDFIEAFTEIES